MTNDKCRCGNPLPTVTDSETPFEFCSVECKYNADRNGAVENIARLFLDLNTLETCNSDRLDFKEQSVWSIKSALEAAYDAGRKEGEPC